MCLIFGISNRSTYFLFADVRMAEADELQLTDGETYFVTVRTTNQLGYTYSTRSDGITVQVEPLLPGVVRDGHITGFDLNYQPSVTTLSGNWDWFGKDGDSDIKGNFIFLLAKRQQGVENKIKIL